MDPSENPTIEGTLELVGVSADKAEGVASRMVAENRLQANALLRTLP